MIVGAWLVSRIWIFEPGISSDSEVVQEPVTEQEPDPEPEPVFEPEPEPDTGDEDYSLAEQDAAEELALRRNAVLEESRLLFRGYFYDEAIELLNADETLIDHETQTLESQIIEARNGLVRFDGDIKHISFRSLILDPAHLISDSNDRTDTFNEGFVYQSELFRLLPQLLERGYVLYNVNEIFNKGADGSMRRNAIYLPRGKRPLILSVIDPSYRHGIGFANRVILDEHGELATEVITPAGETLITYDGDVHLVVDAFVQENPEFSYRGSKGIIATTGHLGIFGYDLLTDGSVQDAIAISNMFKENGWLFANHSYTHNRVGFWGPESNPDNISFDVRRWREAIEPVVGSTNIFVAPFGFLLSGEGMQTIIDNGYDIYCTADISQAITVNNTHVIMGRMEIGGYTLARHADILNRDFFDVASVIDPHRPPIASR